MTGTALHSFNPNINEHTTNSTSKQNENKKFIISMALYGSDPKYVDDALDFKIHIFLGGSFTFMSCHSPPQKLPRSFEIFD